jgi:hypothetical protein
MTDSASADSPVAIDRVDRGRGDGEGIRLRLTGRWLGGDHPAEHEALLVIQLQGRRHRFPPAREEGGGALPPGAWAATFTIPSWAEPSQPGQAALWIGNTVVPVPLPGSRLREVPAAAPATAPAPVLAPAPAPAPALTPAPGADAPRDPSVAVVDSGRAGPLAELLFRESVSALHSELEQRSGETARLRGALADAQSELEARSAMQAALESAHGDLRGEVQELMAAVGRQHEEFEQRLGAAEKRLAEAESDRDRARRELDSERARGQRELDSERTRVAQTLDAERTRGQHELESERSRTTQQLAELGAARDAAADEAAALRDRLSAISAAQQQRADEASALREQLAIATVTRDGAAGEVAGLRAELERLGSELAVTREQVGARGGDLGEAQRLLADARALTEQLRGQSSQ